MTKAQIEEFIPQLPYAQKWVAADTSDIKVRLKIELAESLRSTRKWYNHYGKPGKFLRSTSIIL